MNRNSGDIPEQSTENNGMEYIDDVHKSGTLFATIEEPGGQINPNDAKIAILTSKSKKVVDSFASLIWTTIVTILLMH